MGRLSNDAQQQQFARTSSARGSASSRWGRRLVCIFCAAIFVLVALLPADPAAGFDSFNAFTSLEDAAGIVILSDRDEGTNLIDPIPPNTAFTSFIGGAPLTRMPTSIPTRSSAWQPA